MREIDSELLSAVKGGLITSITDLIRVGANPNVQDTDGLTPLCIAALNGNADLCSRLVKAGAETTEIFEFCRSNDRHEIIDPIMDTIRDMITTAKADGSLGLGGRYSPPMSIRPRLR